MNFSTDGAEQHAKALSDEEMALLAGIAESTTSRRPGTRLTGDENLHRLLAMGSALDRVAKSELGDKAKPVRAVLFDKSEGSNWALGWHQDRTIAVKEKVDAPGFGPWSVKSGITHVEPSFELLEQMVTLRAHLDAVDEDNAPLLIAPGSHRLGKLPVHDIAAVVERLGSTTCLAESRDVWAYATPILHASEAAKVPSHRRVLQVDYSAEDLPGELEWFGV